MKEPALHRLAPTNAALLEQVAEDVFDDDIDPEQVAAYLAEPGHLMVVATVDGQVVGQCQAVVHRHVDKPTELYIDNLGVAPAFKRQGIARRMVDETLAWGGEFGCRTTWVLTEPDNAEGRGFYEAGGAAGAAAIMYEYKTPEQNPI